MVSGHRPASPASASPSLAALAPLAARAFASGEELATAVLDLVRSLTGLDTALVVRTEGGEWTAAHASGAHFGVRPGDTLPLRDTF